MIIAGIGTAVPKHKIEQAASLEIMRGLIESNRQIERKSNAIYEHSGVEYRHSVILDQSEGEYGQRQTFFQVEEPSTRERMQRYEHEAVEIARRACEVAIGESATQPGQITHLINVSCTGFFAPGPDIQLIEELGLSPEIARTNVGFMGCHGLFNGLRVAKAYTDADPDAVVLVSAVELCSLHHQYEWTNDKMVANALFADGAAAVVCRAAQKTADHERAMRLVGNGSTVFAGSQGAMSWKIADHGFEMTLSPETPKLIEQNLRPWLERWLGGHGLRLDEIGSWAVHPGGPRILQAMAEGVSMPIERLAESYAILKSYGNMSSPTIAFIIDQLRQKQAPMPLVAVGFGPGLVAEAALFA